VGAHFDGLIGRQHATQKWRVSRGELGTLFPRWTKSQGFAPCIYPVQFGNSVPEFRGQGNKIPVYKSFAEIAVMIREERGDARNWMKAGLAPISISNGLLLAGGLCGY